jgi:hypothetical protein
MRKFFNGKLGGREKGKRKTKKQKNINTLYIYIYSMPSPWTATLTWWESLCLFDLKKADQRQSEIKWLARPAAKLLN